MLQDYEEKKKRINYLQCPQAINLRGKNPRLNILIPEDQIRKAFDLTYRDVLNLLKKELSRMTRLDKDFAVLFAGGSYCNPGLYNTVKAIMEESRRNAEARNIRIKHVFLRDEKRIGMFGLVPQLSIIFFAY